MLLTGSIGIRRFNFIRDLRSVLLRLNVALSRTYSRVGLNQRLGLKIQNVPFLSATFLAA